MKRAAIIASLALAWLCVATPARAQGEQKKRRQLTTAAATCGLPDSTGYIALQVGNANGGATLTLAGTWSGTISFFASGDGGATWNAVNVTPSNSTTAVTTATANGTWQLNPAAYTHICAAFTTATSGTALATIQLSTASARSSGGGGGGGGTPGGSSGQIQYNNSGAFGGVAVTGSGSVVEATGPTMTNPVVGTQTALDNSTKAASTAYTDTAVGVETTRATAAEATKAAAFSGTTDTVPKFTASTTIGNSKLTDSGTLLSYTAGGTFVSGSRSDSVVSVVNGPCPTSLFGDTSITEAISGCTVTPASGVTNGINVGIGGFAEANDPNAGGLFGDVYAVGAYLNTRCMANNTTCEGGVSQANSAGSLTGVHLYGHEVSVFPSNVGDVGAGILLDMLGDNVSPTFDNMPAVEVQSPTGGTGTFSSGFRCDAGSTGSGGACIELRPIAATGGSASQRFEFTANNGSANFTRIFTLEEGGNWYADAAPIIGLPGAFGTYLTSTSAVSYNQLVKIDTSNADAIVPCTTADTTACMGFVADNLGSGTGGLCGAAGTCAIVTTAGSVVKGILGTGTCSIGDYVIVDTTTNGDIKCTGTPPTLHSEIGLALSAQSSVGQTVDVLTKFE